MDNEKLDPTKSKCFTCEYGLCMLQENTAHIEANFTMDPPFGHNIDPEPEIPWDSDADDDDEEGGEIKKIVETRVCSLCYWAPAGQSLENPVVTVATIKNCSRYKKR